jgi:hypothetical protein
MESVDSGANYGGRRNDLGMFEKREYQEIIADIFKRCGDLNKDRVAHEQDYT